MNDSYINSFYDRLPGSYLFSTIAKKIKEYQGTHENADIIRLGIGDVTTPLIPEVINAMHKAVDEMAMKDTFRGYGPEQGYDFFPIMAAIRYDVDPLLKKIQEMLTKLPPIAHFEPEPPPVLQVEDFADHSVTIKNNNGIYTVEGDWLPT